MSKAHDIPYRTTLPEKEIPNQWLNLRGFMKEKPDPLINPVTFKPVTLSELCDIFSTELAKQELNDTDTYIDIPEKLMDLYRQYRPSPLCRAYHLEKALDTPAKIYYKFEGNNTAGSHKLNSSITQVVDHDPITYFPAYQRHYALQPDGDLLRRIAQAAAH